MANVYIDLDALIDSRLGIFMNISPELAAQVYADGYPTRFSDNYKLMNYLEFKERYNDRNKGTISTPLPTMVMSFLEHHIMSIRQDNILRGGDGMVKVFLNVYPYVMSRYEETILLSGFKSKLPVRTEVEIVHDEALSPTNILDDKIVTVMKYDGVNWIENLISNKKIMLGELSGVELIVPDIINTTETIKVNKDEILGELTTIFSQFINLTFIATAMFSATIPKPKK